MAKQKTENPLSDNAFQTAMEYHQKGDFAQADALYRQILQQQPNNPDALHCLGLLAYQLGQNQAAVELIGKAVGITPTSCQMYCNLGLALHALGKFDAAIESYQQALLLQPDYSAVYYNLGNALQAQGKLVQAIESYKKALELTPDYIDAHNNLGLLLLSLGQFKEGWQHYAARYDPRIKTRTVFVPNFKFPQWQGESIAGKSLLVWCEQGLGDDIQFCRYVSVLKSYGARHITWVCRKPLKELLKTLESIDSVLSLEEAALITPHDYWTFALSIPLFCKTTLDNIPATIPYLHANSESVSRIAASLKAVSEFKVGICWKGNPAHANDANRSPGIAAFKSLFDRVGVKFFTLQPDTRAEFISAAGTSGLDRGHEIDQSSFEEAAALIMNLDLVISCDTSICHLAAALGKPVWIVLPFVADWRWMMDREDSSWYPNVRLFRQSQPGNWNDVFQQIEKRLKKVIAGESQVIWPIV